MTYNVDLKTGLEVVDGIVLAPASVQWRDVVSTAVKYVSLGCYALSSGKHLPTFRRIVVATSLFSSIEEESSLRLLDLDVAGTAILRNVGKCLPVGTA